MIHSLEIEQFRLFSSETIKLGKRLTAIAGQNATGKSTLLGIIGHMVEHKNAKNIFGKRYRTEFSEVFKSSEKFDKTGSHKGTINFCNINGFEKICDRAKFRSTWQKKSTKSDERRFRVIPKRTTKDGKSTEAKYPIPVIYLGLSRLFPLGEINNDNDITTHSIDFTPKEKEEYLSLYSMIMPSKHTLKELSRIQSKSIKADFTGVDTEAYDRFCNSSGQDNLGQILLALLSFERLKASFNDDPENNWNGGLLLIDELESTFHSHSQLKLIEVLFKKAKKLDIQIVFTTHSTTILENIASKYSTNKKILKDYQLQYISNANTHKDKHIEIIQNPSWNYIKNNLYVTIDTVAKPTPIIVYSEDEITRLFFSKLIRGFNNRVKMIDVKLGKNQLEKLLKGDPSYFSKALFVVDGDVENTDPKLIKRSNVLKLPTKTFPEQMLFDYLNSEHCKFWDLESIVNSSFNHNYLITTHGPTSGDYSGEATNKNKTKSWFVGHLSEFKKFNVIEQWIKENKEITDKFKLDFISKFNIIAEEQGIPIIPIKNKI